MIRSTQIRVNKTFLQNVSKINLFFRKKCKYVLLKPYNLIKLMMVNYIGW